MALIRKTNDREEITVFGYSRIIQTQKRKPLDIITLIVQYYHDTHNHLFTLNGDIHRLNLQRECIKDIAYQTVYRWRQIKRFQDKDIMILPTKNDDCCNFRVQIPIINKGLAQSRISLTGNRSIKNYFSDSYQLQCKNQPHGPNEMCCIGYRFYQYKLLKDFENTQPNQSKHTKTGSFHFFTEVKGQKYTSVSKSCKSKKKNNRKSPVSTTVT
eukprot:157177_1